MARNVRQLSELTTMSNNDLLNAYTDSSVYEQFAEFPNSSWSCQIVLDAIRDEILYRMSGTTPG